MKPARQTSPTPRALQLARERPIEVVADGERPVIEDQRLDARRRARASSPPASARLEMTTAIARRERAVGDRVDERLKIAAAA